MLPGLGQVGDVNKTLNPALEALQLHKAAKVHEPTDFALVDTPSLRLVQQGGRGRPVACWAPSILAAIPVLWTDSAVPFAIPVSAATAVLTLPVSVPVAISVRTVPIVPWSSILIWSVASVPAAVRLQAVIAIGCACAGIIV